MRREQRVWWTVTLIFSCSSPILNSIMYLDRIGNGSGIKQCELVAHCNYNIDYRMVIGHFALSECRFCIPKNVAEMLMYSRFISMDFSSEFFSQLDTILGHNHFRMLISDIHTRHNVKISFYWFYFSTAIDEHLLKD